MFLAQELFGVRDAARTLKISEPYVRYLTDTNRLACRRDANGRRLFRMKDIRAFSRQRRRPSKKPQLHPAATG